MADEPKSHLQQRLQLRSPTGAGPATRNPRPVLCKRGTANPCMASRAPLDGRAWTTQGWEWTQMLVRAQSTPHPQTYGSFSMRSLRVPCEPRDETRLRLACVLHHQLLCACERATKACELPRLLAAAD